MAIAFGAAGTVDTNNTQTATPTYPTVAAGDYLILYYFQKYADRSLTTPSGFTLLGSATGGAGTDGTSQEGQVKVLVYGKEATGSESGTITLTTTGGTASVSSARIFSFTKGASETWDVVGSAVASDNTAGTSLAWTYDTDPGFIAGDWGVSLWGINSDAYTHTHAMSIPGCSSITTQSRGNTACTVGARGRHGLVTHAVGSGTSSGVATYTNTASGSATNAPAGASVLVRLRVSTGGSNVTMDAATAAYTTTFPSSTFQTVMDTSPQSFSTSFPDASLEPSGGFVTYRPSLDKRRRNTVL